MSELPFYRIDSSTTSRLRVDRSEFIGEIFPITRETGIETILQQTRKRYPDARHQPYAYRIADPPDLVEYCSDDGEPSGTAGRPIQDRLNDLNVVNVLLIVSRYFGGRKLGTRRLRQAFSESARLTLDAVNRIELCRVRSAVVSFPFEMTGTINSIVRKSGGIVELQEYGEGVRLEILFRSEIFPSAIRRLSEVLRNQGSIDPQEGEKLVDA